MKSVIADGRTRARGLLAAAGGVAERQLVIALVAVGWLLATAATGMAPGVGTLHVLVLLAIGAVIASTLHAHRQRRMILREVRLLGAELVREDERPLGVAVGEVLDRVKLHGLTLGRLTEDVARSTQETRQAARDSGARTTAEVEALLALHALAAAERPVPPTRTAAGGPEAALLTAELVVARRAKLVVVGGPAPLAVWCALAARRTGADTRVVALDDDAAAVARAEQAVAALDLGDRVEIRHAALTSYELDGRPVRWYERRAWSDLNGAGLVTLAGSALPRGGGGEPGDDDVVSTAPLGELLADDAAVVLAGLAPGDPDAALLATTLAMRQDGAAAATAVLVRP